MAELRIDGEDTRTLKDILDEIKRCAFMLDNTARCLIMEDIAEIQRRYGDGWIRVDDHLPTKTGEYFVTVSEPIGNVGETTEFVLEAWYNAEKFPYSPDIGWTLLNEFYEFTNRIRERITHWMPLPKPPVMVGLKE